MEALKVLLEKVISFFDLFDISYLVSGVATLGVLYYLPHAGRFLNNLPNEFNTIWWFVACYAIGLASSALGRRVNQYFATFNRKDHLSKYKHFESLIKETKLDSNAWFQNQLIVIAQGTNTTYNESSLKSVYRQMWAALRERKDIPESIALLRRYWLNSSTLDGLTVSSFLSVLVSVTYVINDWSGLETCLTLPIWITISMLIITRLFSQEANRYRRYQIEELVNTYIFLKGKSQ